MARPSRSHSELRVRMVDFEDFGTSGRDSTSRYFHEIGALNTVFRKRLNQALSIHPCIPLADTLHEYIKYQRALEDKYGIILPDQSSPAGSSISATSAASPTLPAKPLPSSSVSSLDSATGVAASPKLVEPKIATPTPTAQSSEESDVSSRPSKRKAVDDETDKGKKSVEPSSIPPFQRGKTTVTSVVDAPRTDEFQSKIKKPAVVSKPVEGAKKPVFAGFDFNKAGTSFGQPAASASTSSFASIFSQSTDNKQDENREPISDAGKSTFKTSFAQSVGAGGEVVAREVVADRTLNEGLSAIPQTTDRTVFRAGLKKDAEVPVEKTSSSFFSFSKPPVNESAKDESSKQMPAATTNSIFGNFGGAGSLPSSGFSGFSFNSFKMPAFNIPPAASDNKEDAAENGDDGEEAEAPPVVPPEERDAVETDAVMSQRCKVFYLDAGKYNVRGTGMAHLKVISDKAVQLLIRAGTALGNILLNARINKETKVSRSSRDKSESVDIVCLPEPAFKGADPKKLYPYVIKFKDAAAADQFYNKIQELLK
ncbi:nuclear pore complex protein Nup50-like [Paramacrobiotus metropolitanus]|uniref:nuclear pore complex protein Nup50-like n=1 Tax=Paramacrobiotus metropolitanus TaxID=2943436 RepID=UPI002445AAF1|nr:nuclear pore complex protein Nup50-like [Paramacrobiotus metropolitanus]